MAAIPKHISAKRQTLIGSGSEALGVLTCRGAVRVSESLGFSTGSGAPT